LVSIPILGFTLFFVRLLTGFRLNGYAQAGLGIFWTANLISFIGIAGNTLSNFKTESTITETLSFPISADTIYLNPIKKNPFGYQRIRFSPLDEKFILEDNQLLCKQLHIEIGKSDTKDLQIEQIITSRGKTIKQAEEAIQMVDFQIDKQNNTILLPTYYSLDKGEKFRGQTVHLKILVPESMYLKLDRQIMEQTWGLQLSNGEWVDWRNELLLKIEADGLVCANCESTDTIAPELSEIGDNQDSLLITEQ
jgi:hypothetical protein